MVNSEGDASLERVNNRYSLVVLAAKRAKQLKEGAPSLIETTSTNTLTIALEEIASGKVTYTDAVEPPAADAEVVAVPVIDTSLPENFLSISPASKPGPLDALPPELAAFLPGNDDDIDADEDTDTDAEEADDAGDEEEDDAGDSELSEKA